AVAGAVVGHHAAYTNAAGGEPGHGTLEESGGGLGGLAFVEHLGVGQAGRVVDSDVEVLPPDAAHAGGAITVHPVAGPADLAELFDVDVDQLACVAALVAVGWLDRVELGQPVE